MDRREKAGGGQFRWNTVSAMASTISLVEDLHFKGPEKLYCPAEPGSHLGECSTKPEPLVEAKQTSFRLGTSRRFRSIEHNAL